MGCGGGWCRSELDLAPPRITVVRRFARASASGQPSQPLADGETQRHAGSRAAVLSRTFLLLAREMRQRDADVCRPRVQNPLPRHRRRA